MAKVLIEFRNILVTDNQKWFSLSGQSYLDSL